MASLERLYNMKIFVLWDWDATLADTYPVTNAAYAYGDGEADLKVAEHLKSKGMNVCSILLDPKNKYKGKIRPSYIIHELNTLPIVLKNEINQTALLVHKRMIGNGK